VVPVRVLATWRARRHAVRRDAVLPEVVERIASSVRAGASVSAALQEAAEAAPPPLDRELGSAAVALAHGAGLEAALAAWRATAGPSPEVALVATALGLGGRAGGEVARALDRVAATLRERREVRAEVRALATQARASAAVLIVAPLGFTLLISTIEPAVPAFLFGSPLGGLCLALGLGLDGLGALWMWHIVDGAT
jgi:tight adherence protein B